MTAVLTALSSRWDGPVVAGLEASGQVRIARRCADLADLLATAASGLGEVAVVSADLRGLSLSEVARLRSDGVEVLGLSDPQDESSEVRLWQLGVHSVVRADAPIPELVAAVLAASADRGRSRPPHPLAGPDGLDGADDAAGQGSGPEDPPHGDRGAPERGAVVTVWGPAGAPGRTSVAVNLAAELAALGRRVVLVDLDTYGGAVAQTLSVLDEAPGVAAAARAADQGSLDRSALARLTPQVLPGLRLLTGIPKADRWPELRGAALERVLEVARSLGDFVVVDVGFCLEDDEELSYDTQAPRRNQATLTSLLCSDTVIAVGGCDPVALQRLVRGLQELATVRCPEPLVVVNRARAKAVGAAPEAAVGQALARFAGVTEATFIPDDPAGFDTAALTGRVLSESVPHSPARRAIAGLAARLAGVPDPPAARRLRQPRRRLRSKR